MQGIYTYIPETNNVPREYIVAAIQLLLFMVPISLVPALALLCFYVSTFRSMCAVPKMAVFCSSLTSRTYYYYYYYIYHNVNTVPANTMATQTHGPLPLISKGLMVKELLHVLLTTLYMVPKGV
jgi:hypothetical protein